MVQSHCLNVNRCLSCSELQGQAEVNPTINLPVARLGVKDTVSISSLLYSYLTSEVARGSMKCQNCNSIPLHNRIKLIKDFPEILIVVLQRNEYDFKTHKNRISTTRVALDNLLDLRFCSLKDMGGEEISYEPISAVGRIGDESINCGHYVTYIIETNCQQIIKFDDTKIAALHKDSLLSEEFQRELYIAVYRKCSSQKCMHDNDAKKIWKVTDDEKTVVANLFAEKCDKDLGMITLFSLKSLQSKNWLHSEVVDLSFLLIQRYFKTTCSYSFILMKKKDGDKSIIPDVLRKLSPDTNIILLPIQEGSHWYCALVFLFEKIVIVLDSCYKKKKLAMQKKVLRICSIISMARKETFVQESWHIIQPTNVLKQNDGCNCGVYAFVNAFLILKEDSVPLAQVSDLELIRLWLAAKII